MRSLLFVGALEVLASASHDGAMLIWDTGTLQVIKRVEDGEIAEVRTMPGVLSDADWFQLLTLRHNNHPRGSAR